MRAARTLLVCVGLLAGCAVGSSGLPTDPPEVIVAEPGPVPGRVSFGGGSVEKALLTPRRPEPADRGLYVYLLAMPGAQPDQMAALAGAFSCHFEGRARGRQDRPGSQRAVFLWPVRDGEGLRPDSAPGALRRAYDHDEARALLWAARDGRSHRRVGGIYVVASNARLATVPEGMVAPAEISDLTDHPPREIEAALLQLQVEIERGGALSVPGHRQTLLGILASIGEVVALIFPVGSAEAGPASVCRG